MLYKREMEAAHKHVILADAGDSIQGGSAGTLTKGAAITELMNYVGYDVAVTGNHEFDYSVETLKKRGEGRYVDTATNLKIHEIDAEMDDILSKKIASSDFGLYMYDPETGDRIARNHETNLGDFCADAFREICGTDVGILNGGSLRKDIKARDITFGDILNVYPYSNKVCAGRMSGQTLLDMLEFGSSVYPEQLGGFLQVSGVEYTIDYSVPSSVESNEFGEYTGVSGEYKVKNVKVGGKPLDPDKIYTVASTNYLLQNAGDGYVFGDKCEVYYESKELDVELLERFITDKLGGIIPEEYKEVYGQGRIHFVDGVEEDSSQPQEDSSLPEDESSQPQDESSQPQDDSSAAESSQAEESTAPADSKSSDTNPKTGLEATAAVLLVAAIAVSYAACRRKK